MSLSRSCRSIVPSLFVLVGAMVGLAGSGLPEPAQAKGLVRNSTAQPLAQAEATEAEDITIEFEEADSQPSTALVLERPETDPLLPGQTNGRDLPAQEQNRLRLGLERLEREANATYQQGDRPGAYRKFFRILSLSQYLPVDEELGYLTRVGRLVWEDSQAEAVQTISARVRTLEVESDEKISLSRRQAFAEAYDSLGAWKSAIAQYETLLAVEQPDGAKGSTGLSSPLTETTLVNRLAQLSLFSLDYPAAALYTEQAISLAPQAEASPLEPNSTPDLLSIALPSASPSPAERPTEIGDVRQELPLPSELSPAQTNTGLLIQLAYVYEQDRRFAEAAAVQQQLLPLYSDPVLAPQQPALQVAIARNQARSGQLVEAIATYQAAYSQSQTLQQFAVSKAALSQLAGLYRSQEQLEDALSVYDVLLQVNDLSYDLYGLADTQANRAEILTALQRFEAARRAYRQALHAARLLGYREAELQQRLDDLPSA